LEEERVDTQKMEKKIAKISLSLSLSLSHTHTHTQHTCSHFFVQEQGKNIKSFRDIEKQQGQRQKIIWESALLIIWLTSSSVWYWKKERKKEGTYLGWDFIVCTKQKFVCNNSFIQPNKKNKNKKKNKKTTI
jgi:hypothetical protein